MSERTLTIEDLRVVLSAPTEDMIERAAEAWVMAKEYGPDGNAAPSSIPWEHLNAGLKRQYRVRAKHALLAALWGSALDGEEPR